MSPRVSQWLACVIASFAPATALPQSAPRSAISSPAHSPSRARARTPARPPCLSPPVTLHQLHGGAYWRGALTDCAGRPTVSAMAALATLAAPRTLDTLPDLAPAIAAIRRLAPAAAWPVADPTRPTATVPAPRSCAPGLEALRLPDLPAPAPVTAVHHVRRGPPRSARAPSPEPRSPQRGPIANPAPRPAVSRWTCRRIDVVRDPHTHDAVLLLPERVRVLHPRLLPMLQRVATAFPGRAVDIVSGYRPSSDLHAGSRHAHGRALDFRVSGVSRERLRDVARSLPNVGVGYYPNSVFVHMDVRDLDEGGARWTDFAGPGERARYGRWPPNRRDVDREIDFATRRAERILGNARTSHRRDEPTPEADSSTAARPNPSPSTVSDRDETDEPAIVDPAGTADPQSPAPR